MTSPADIAVSLLPFFAGWTIAACPYDSAHWCDLVRSDGATLRVYGGDAGWVPKGRVEVAGVFPRTKDGQTLHHDAPPRITCAIGRGAKAIAKEISRRLLPEYLARFDHLKAQVSIADQHVDDAELVASRIVAQLGGDTRASHEPARYGNTKRIYTRLDHVYALKVSPGYGDNPTSVDVELLRMSPELASEVLALVQAAEARANAAPVRVDVPVSREVVEDDVEVVDVEPLRRRIA